MLIPAAEAIPGTRPGASAPQSQIQSSVVDTLHSLYTLHSFPHSASSLSLPILSCHPVCLRYDHDIHLAIPLLCLIELPHLQDSRIASGMARRKQAVPLQREPSDFAKGPSESPSHGWKQSNGVGQAVKPSVANGWSGSEKLPLSVIEQAGPLQLLICVGGIYASL